MQAGLKGRKEDGKPLGFRQYAQAVSVYGCILFSNDALPYFTVVIYMVLVYVSLSMKLQQSVVSTAQGSFSVIQVKFLSNLVQKMP